MSTRSMLDFYNTCKQAEAKNPKPTARLYNHWDGYPSGRIQDIKKAVDRALGNYNKNFGFDYRKTEMYASDLAAFYVLANKPKGRHEYDYETNTYKEETIIEEAGDVEIDNFLHGDIEYLYQVVSCDKAFPGIRIRILVPDHDNHPMTIPCEPSEIKKIGKYPLGHDRFNGGTLKRKDGTVEAYLYNKDSFWDHPTISRMTVLAKDHSDPNYPNESGDWATLATQIKRHCKEGE